MTGLKLLVVEDSSADLELITEFLEQLHARVRAVCDSREAAGLIQQEKFDGIFLDVRMPNVTGFELARLTRESVCNRSTPMVMVTGQDEKDTMHLSFSLGATYFLQKPIDSRQLAHLLQEIQRQSYENRRRFARVPLNAEVTCKVRDKTLDGLTWNISQGGIQVEVAGLEMGDDVQMSFILPQAGTVIKAQGFVVWAREDRYGLYFTEMALEFQEAIRAHVLRG